MKDFLWCVVSMAVMLVLGVAVFGPTPALAASPVPAATPDVSVVVNGVRLATDVPVHIAAGRTLLPVRAVAEQLGATVVWNQANQTVVITRGFERVVLTINETAAQQNGTPVTLDVPAMVIDGRTLVPVRFVGETLGTRVAWIQDQRMVTVDGVTSERPPLVFGYYLGKDDPEPGLSYQSTSLHDRELDGVIIASYYMKADGTLDDASYESKALFELAASRHLSVFALVKNEGFSRTGASQLLQSDSARTRALETLRALIDRGYAGINLDFENLDPKDRDNYTQFVGDVSRVLRTRGALLTLSVPAKSSDNPDHGWSGAFDYEALAPLADYVMVMAYDQYWGNGSVQGPIAGIPWVRKMLDYAVTAIPRSKLILGVPGYAYDWVDGTTTATSMGAFKAVELAGSYGAATLWDEESQTPYFRYEQNGQAHEVHYDDARSLRVKLGLVREYGLAGIALWRLGYEVPGAWQEIATWRYATQ